MRLSLNSFFLIKQKIDKNTYNLDYKIYDTFLKANPDGYYCISNYDDINKLIKN